MERRTDSTGSLAAKIKLFTGPGTRRWPRFNIEDVPSVKGIHSNAGSEIQVANISRGGALLQTRKRLAPGTRIRLEVVTVEDRFPLAGFVLRSCMSSPNGTPRYQAAVAFDTPLQIPAPWFSRFRLFPYEGGLSLYTPARDGNAAAISAFFAVSFSIARDAALNEMLKLNDW